MLMSCYVAVGDSQAARRTAHIALSRAAKALTQDPNNGTVTAYSAYALATLGEAERAKERMNRALLIDPDNWNMRYNFACALQIVGIRSEEHTSELQSLRHLVCRLLLEKKNKNLSLVSGIIPRNGS